MPCFLKGAAVFGLAVAVVGGADPGRAGGGVALEGGVDDFQGVGDARVVRGAEAEADEGEDVRADDLDGGAVFLPKGWFGKEDLEVADVLALDALGRGLAEVVAGDAVLLGERGVGDVEELVDGVVPGVGGGAEEVGAGGVGGFDAVGGGEEGGDLGGHGEGGVAGGGLPAILLGEGAVFEEEAGDGVDEGAGLEAVEGVFAAELVGEQDGEGDAVHLDGAEVGCAVEPHVLAPAAVGVLGGAEIEEGGAGAAGVAGGELAHGGLAEVARPEDVVAADVGVGAGEAPGEGEAGDEAAGEAFGLVGLEDGGGDAVHVERLAGGGGVVGEVGDVTVVGLLAGPLVGE